MNEPTALAPQHCPLCGQPNACAMEIERSTGRAQPPCWCTRVDFSPEQFAKIPEPALGRACICHACAGGTSAV